MEEKIVIFGIDDACPDPRFGGTLDNGQLGLVKKLNSTFGLKTTLFVPLNFEGRWHLSKHPEFITYLRRLTQHGHEISAHGFFHRANNPRLGAMEFVEYNEEQTDKALDTILKTWLSLGVDIKGIKFPGWGETKFTEELSHKYFSYIASHISGEKPIIGFGGIMKLPYNLSIDNLYDYGQKVYIMQAHIGEDPNTENNLNIINYTKVVNFLHELNRKYKIRYMTFNEYMNYLKGETNSKK